MNCDLAADTQEYLGKTRNFPRYSPKKYILYAFTFSFVVLTAISSYRVYCDRIFSTNDLYSFPLLIFIFTSFVCNRQKRLNDSLLDKPVKLGFETKHLIPGIDRLRLQWTMFDLLNSLKHLFDFICVGIPILAFLFPTLALFNLTAMATFAFSFAIGIGYVGFIAFYLKIGREKALLWYRIFYLQSTMKLLSCYIAKISSAPV